MIKEYKTQVIHKVVAPAAANWCPGSPWAAGYHPPVNSTQFYGDVWCIVWNVPLASYGQLPWLWPLLASCAVSLLAGQYEKLNSLWLGVSTVQ